MRLIGGTLVAAALGFASPAVAAEQRGAAPVTSTTGATPSPAPDRTTASFGDWTMTCTQRPAGTPAGPGKQCEAQIGISDQQRQPILIFAIGRATREQPMQAVIQVPVNIRTLEPLRLVLDGANPITIPFQQCNRLGCFARAELRDDTLVKRLRAHNPETPAKVEWKDSNSNDLAVPLSTRGFAGAYDALIAADAGR